MAVAIFSRITVAVADPGDGELFRYARLLGEIAPASTTFRFVHVMGRRSQSAVPALTHRAALESLRRAAEMHMPSAVTWQCHVRRGDRIDQVLHDVAEWGSDLLLIGHRRASSGRRSMARRLAMKAPCSLWLVPEGTARPIRRLLVAVDFSPASAHAVGVAAVVAQRARAAQCVLLHVRTPVALGGESDVDAIARASDEQAFRRFLAPVDLRGVPVDARTAESASIPGTIARVALDEGADLVVAGTRGRSPSATVLLGGESEQLLSESVLPLLVTRPRGDRPGLLEALLDQDFKPAHESLGR